MILNIHNEMHVNTKVSFSPLPVFYPICTNMGMNKLLMYILSCKLLYDLLDKHLEGIKLVHVCIN